MTILQHLVRRSVLFPGSCKQPSFVRAHLKIDVAPAGEGRKGLCLSSLPGRNE